LLAFVGGYGGYIFCDYHDSPVGPYKELVFVPGAYDYYDSSTGRSTRGRSVVSIWVNNEVNISSFNLLLVVIRENSARHLPKMSRNSVDL
jgi:hypothetical protein